MELLSAMSNSVAVFMLWLFVTAGISKLMPANRDYYIEVMAGYGLVLPELAKTLPVLVGLAEIVTGVLTLIPHTRLFGVMASVSILLIYFGVMANKVLAGEKNIRCGCSGPGVNMNVSPVLLVRNAVLIALLIFSGMNIYSVDVDAGLWLVSIIFALIFIIVSLSTEQLIINEQKIKVLKAL
ncbi:MauE/DoxX family redox-associated membrane protein [Dasania marina]|uniref:MauE/DoxX family redox-associated membrane protein n=1 Tax=Dasania marina TaxID=471499 RepID=UPI000379A672|nr:MauE/DoxX family redox-associated membrane protein [Dasania marina]